MLRSEDEPEFSPSVFRRVGDLRDNVGGTGGQECGRERAGLRFDSIDGASGELVTSVRLGLRESERLGFSYLKVD